MKKLSKICICFCATAAISVNVFAAATPSDSFEKYLEPIAITEESAYDLYEEFLESDFPKTAYEINMNDDEYKVTSVVRLCCFDRGNRRYRGSQGIFI